ncbi:MAG: DUF6572 domain-containing protein [Myxococcaceae bacterium]
MSIEQPETIDAIGIETGTGLVVLTLIDPFDWSSPETHLQMLQAKLNTYLRYEERGDLYLRYPDAKGRRVVFHLVARHAIPSEVSGFFDKVRSALRKATIEFRVSH